MRAVIRSIAIGSLAMLVACVSSPPPAGSRDEAVAAECHPAADPAVAQYIVGYGSLMQDESRARTSPRAGPAHPVEVNGFVRRWIARAETVGFSATYLGVTPDAAGAMNAVVYRIDLDELAATDRREASYCRASVAATQVKPAERLPVAMEAGQVWIYVNKPGAVAAPTARFPIVESYVDIFVSGCLEQEQRFNLEGFAQRCITTTHEWSAHWVNDRIYPRRPFIYQPKARQIDALLAKSLPDYFARIRIE